MEKTKIILVGKAASGKDYFKDFLLKKGYKTSISHTTRPMREGETQQKEYYFIDDKLFKDSIKENMFFEYKEFNSWLYGTSNRQMKASNVFIFTPSGIKSLPFNFKKLCTIVYFDIDEKQRLERLKLRSDVDSVSRRLKADEHDFMDFKDFNIRVADNNYDCEYLLKKILAYQK